MFANLHSIDIVLIAAYFAVVVYIGVRVAKRHAGTADYFLAGRRLGWVVIGMSLFASNISSTTSFSCMSKRIMLFSTAFVGSGTWSQKHVASWVKTTLPECSRRQRKASC